MQTQFRLRYKKLRGLTIHFHPNLFCRGSEKKTQIISFLKQLKKNKTNLCTFALSNGNFDLISDGSMLLVKSHNSYNSVYRKHYAAFEAIM